MKRRSVLAEAFRRPYPVTLPMILLLLIIPGYIFIGDLLPPQSLHVPLLILRDRGDIRRTSVAYLTLRIAAYCCFLEYPTAAPHPEKLFAHDFFAWDLQMIYSADVPANCFP